MLLASLTGVRKDYGADTILTDITLKISTGRKLGLIGPNGSGKSTLIRVLTGDDPATAGTVYRAGDIRIGHVCQHVDVPDGKTVLEYALDDYLSIVKALKAEELSLAATPESAIEKALESYQRVRDAYDRLQGDYFEDRARGMLDALGLAGKFDQPVQTLSGGEKNVLSLARALLIEPDLLVLDEPGNHLDYNGVAWLESFLVNFRGAVLIVSHNRYLLDRVAEGIYHLDNGSVRYYDGGYSAFRETRLRELLAQQSDYAANQKRLDQLEQLVKRFEQIARVNSDPAWGKRLRARRSQLKREKAGAVERPVGDAPAIKLQFTSQGSRADIALQVKDYTRSFGDRVLLNEADLEIRCGEQVALIGPNGSGKSTFLRDVVSRGSWDSTEIRIGPSLRMYYCAQEQEIMDPQRTILEEIRNTAPLSRDESAKFMSKFQFGWHDLQKQIKMLSGGERNRVQLALMVLNKPNFLILDEPTNHLDIPTREAVEEALLDLDATILVVSHDRYFLDKIIQRVVAIENGKFVSYPGSFSEYWIASQQTKTRSGGRISKRRQERTSPRKTSGKSMGDPAVMEKKINAAESEKTDLERLINNAFESNDYREGRNLSRKLERINARLDELYEQWMDTETSESN